VKIIDRVKAYVRQRKGSDPQSTGDPLDGAAGPGPVQGDQATQNSDDKRLAEPGPTAPETPESESAPESAPDSAHEEAAESATEPTTEPTTEQATEPTTEPTTEQATEPTTEPTTEQATEPTAEPPTEEATAPAACPRCGATGDEPCRTPSGKPTKTHKGRVQ
jgi:hypothetical protein